MTAAEEITALRREVERLRRELEEAFAMARGIGEERNELAFKLGIEIARGDRLRDALKLARNSIVSLDEDAWRCFNVDEVVEQCDAALAGEGKG